MNSAERGNEEAERGVQEGSAGRGGETGSKTGGRGVARVLEEGREAAPGREAAALARLTRAVERLVERLAVDSAPVAVTKARAARELEVSTKTIDRMCRAGELKTTLVRGMMRIPFAEVLRVAHVAPPLRAESRVEKFNARQAAEATRAALRKAR